MCCMLHLSSNAFKSNDVLEMSSVEEAMTGVSGKNLVETERRTNKLNPQFWLFHLLFLFLLLLSFFLHLASNNATSVVASLKKLKIGS